MEEVEITHLAQVREEQPSLQNRVMNMQDNMKQTISQLTQHLLVTQMFSLLVEQYTWQTPKRLTDQGNI
jgi:hypothetical protein